MKKSNESVIPLENQLLELPDWGGMNETSQRVSPDAAFKLCEQYPELFPEQAKRHLTQRRKKNFVEFSI